MSTRIGRRPDVYRRLALRKLSQRMRTLGRSYIWNACFLLATSVPCQSTAQESPLVTVTVFPRSNNKLLRVHAEGDLCPAPARYLHSGEVWPTDHTQFSLENCPQPVRESLISCAKAIRAQFVSVVPDALSPEDAGLNAPALMLLALNSRGRMGLLIVSARGTGSRGQWTEWKLYEVANRSTSNGNDCPMKQILGGRSVRDAGLSYRFRCSKGEKSSSVGLESCYERLYHSPHRAYQLQFTPTRVVRKAAPPRTRLSSLLDATW